MTLWSHMIPSLLCIWRGNYIDKVKAASQLRGYDAGADNFNIHFEGSLFFSS